MALMLFGAVAAAQEAGQQQGETGPVATVQKFFSALKQGDVDAALKCFTFPLLALSVPDDPSVPPEQATFDTADDLRPEIEGVAGEDVAIQDAELAYQRGAVAAVSGTIVQSGQEVGTALFVLANMADEGWQIKVIFIPQ